MEFRNRIRTRNAGEKLADGSVVPDFTELSIKPIEGKEPKSITVVAFGHRFENIDQGFARELVTLEREGAIYSEFWDEATQTFSKYRIEFLPAEIYEFVEANIAGEEFSALLQRLGDEDAALDAFPKKKYVDRLRAYSVPDFGGIKPKYWICRAAFYGPDLESLVCGWKRQRYERLDIIPTSSAELMQKIMESFSVAVRHLRHRRGGRPSFEIEHEFDLQDMLYVILKSVFIDARLEEYTLAHAGTQKRIDIVIPSISSIVETKIVRTEVIAARFATR